jgi:hypothetical protein
VKVSEAFCPRGWLEGTERVDRWHNNNKEKPNGFAYYKLLTIQNSISQNTDFFEI